ncbi:hypothetical protein N8964_01960 [Pontimonas sp.]|nr:hypothetical protein [Pontimonas sp.]
MGVARDFQFRHYAREEDARSRKAYDAIFGHGPNSNQSWASLETHNREVFFVLGSGASVAGLRDYDFDFFSRGYSVGINTWALHPFVPSAYSYEFHADTRLLGFLNREQVRQRGPHLLMLRPRDSAEFASYRALPLALRANAIMYGRANLVTKNPRRVSDDLGRALQWLRRHPEILALPDNGASVARMVSLAILLNFRRIVLVGVDLLGTDYFWHRDPELIAPIGLTRWDTVQRGERHETLSSHSRPFPIDIWLAKVGEGLRRRGLSLETWSAESALAQHLPVSPENRS